MSVSVLLPTYKRPQGLRQAVESVLAQTRMPDELIIIDNSPEGDAAPIARNAAAVARFDVVYVHAPEPGVANARNAGLAAAKHRYIAFLDDDEIASVGWLEALLTTAETEDAGIVFGPLRGETTVAGGLRDTLARRLYSRPGADTDHILDKPFGCGNSLVDREKFSIPDQAFDPVLNETGGEDDAFFAALMTQDARLAWSAKAMATECVDPKRTAWKHLLARSFAFGQGATQNCIRGEKPNWPGVVFWMGVGAAQLLIFTPIAAITTVVRSPQAALWIDKTVQAAGKIAWLEQFEPRFYGTAAK